MNLYHVEVDHVEWDPLERGRAYSNMPADWPGPVEDLVVDIAHEPGTWSCAMEDNHAPWDVVGWYAEPDEEGVVRAGFNEFVVHWDGDYTFVVCVDCAERLEQQR